ncbi:FadR/GntR family transcriptional regulator [Bacillus sp. Marseille-P3661]|uniref:FadR/GntR family transcriptional regulator n=1 Tax=Bacillus sp. Marseille-P3661 TaxID=1936234 RepID=UPI000C8592BD|nr:FadR/GntR family transcriptional regulator [Bacillus sp. Marseille-P3661]
MQPFEKISVTDHIVNNLKDLITSGDLKVGDKMPTEKEVCEKLKVGRSSVREAYRVLNALGYIELIPGRGAFVKRITEEDNASIANWFEINGVQIQDFMEVRQGIETLAVTLAIKNGKDSDFNELKIINEKFKKAVEDYNVVQLISLDELFHKKIVDATHNILLIEIYKLITDSFKNYRTKSFSVKEKAIHALEPHNNIVRAILEKDESLAAAEVARHIRISIKDIEDVIKSGNDK